MQRRKFMSAHLGAAALYATGGWQAAIACASATPRLRLYSASDLAFGTTIRVQLLHDSAAQAQRAIDGALAAARKVDALMSVYRPGSQVFELNRTGRLGRPAPQLLTVLAWARRLSQATGGAFDVTVQPLWSAYAGAAKQGRLPADGAIDAAHRAVDWRSIAADAQGVRLLGAGMAITLNGIAQGYAADLALDAVRTHGVRHALLDMGEFSALGERPQHRPWTLAVQDPRRPDHFVAAIEADGRCIATSGDYATSFSTDFSSNHIFDPHTGRSPTQLASATVLAPTGMLADGLSTAFMVLGTERAHRLAAAMGRVDFLLVDKTGNVFRSKSFPGRLA